MQNDDINNGKKDNANKDNRKLILIEKTSLIRFLPDSKSTRT